MRGKSPHCLHQWHAWFAWHPIKINKTIRWLTKVDRKLSNEWTDDMVTGATIKEYIYRERKNRTVDK